MSTSRLEQLLEFYREDPNDAFTLYGIALEYTKSDDGKALEFFTRLLNDHSHYIPTYYHAGKLHEKLGMKEKAGEIYSKGMSLSKEKGNRHAYSELQSAYNQLKGFEEDD